VKTPVSNRREYLRLARGSSRLVHVEAGSTLVALGAEVRIDDAQRWLAERVWTPSVTLEEGQARSFERASWIRIGSSSEGCRVVLVLPAESAGLLSSLFERIIQRFRAAFGHIALS
jgi:hypothetical protein